MLSGHRLLLRRLLSVVVVAAEDVVVVVVAQVDPEQRPLPELQPGPAGMLFFQLLQSSQKIENVLQRIL
jgi:hypothetical protein